jgi:polysaccharide export outer membrane protein
MEGVDGFVSDSYLIREGKCGIMELQGWCWEELPDDAMDEYVDYVEEDDILNLAIYHPARLDFVKTVATINSSIGFRVIDGKINIPDIEEVEVKGLTLTDAREHIEKRFREHIQDIEVFVSYKDRLSRRVEFMGLTGASALPVDGKMRLFECLSKARIPATANLHMSYVLRDGCPLPVDLHRLICHGDMCQNIVMHGGDKVYIASPDAAKITVMGEVFRPVPVNLPVGYMPLQEAIVSAGGIPYTGDRQRIQVIRSGIPNPKIYVVSWDHMVHLPNESLLVMPGDTIYITEKPLTSWNRFISQILPSCTALQTGRTTYEILK